MLVLVLVFIADNLITNPVEEQKSQTQKNSLLGMLLLKNLVIITYIPNVFKGTIKNNGIYVIFHLILKYLSSQ